MTGAENWLDLAGVWSEKEAVDKIPKDLMSGVWSIVEKVPGDFNTPKGRLWLVMPPSVTERGAAFEITRTWKMTGVMTPERLEATRLIYTPL